MDLDLFEKFSIAQVTWLVFLFCFLELENHVIRMALNSKLFGDHEIWLKRADF